MSTRPPLRAEGARSELVAKLYAKAEGWWHMGKDELSVAAARAAAERLAAGGSSVRVGHTEYIVTAE